MCNFIVTFFNEIDRMGWPHFSMPCHAISHHGWYTKTYGVWGVLFAVRFSNLQCAARARQLLLIIDHRANASFVFVYKTSIGDVWNRFLD